MTILRSCCCGYSVRAGSYASAVYTLIYFFLFALLTGNYSYHEVMSRFSRGGTAGREDFGDLTTTTTSTTTTMTTVSTTTTATIIPRNETLSLMEKINTTEGQSPYEVYEKSTGELAIILVDFVSEIAGFFVSIILIRGLQQEKKSYLIPWLIIVPLHTAIDAFSVVNIVIVYVKNTDTESRDFFWGFVTVITVLLDLILNLINVYVFLCVISQYQEYRAGRGTAAYEGLVWQGPVSVHYESGQSGTRSSGGGALNKKGHGKKCHHGRSNGTNPCFSDNEKSDIWCEDLVLDKLDGGDCDNPNLKLTQGNFAKLTALNNCQRSGSAGCPQVRFECEQEANGKQKRKSSGRRSGDNNKNLKASPPSGRSADDVSDTTVTMATLENFEQ